MLETFVKPLLEQVARRFELLTRPCIAAISKKIQSKLSDNVQMFRQVPSVYRMTNRELVNKPSQFMDRLLKPLLLLSESQGFSNLSEGLRAKVNENVIKTALEDMKEVIKEIMIEETKVNESLQKFKKADTSSSQLSDFDKMRVQLLIDLQELNKQVLSIHPNADITQIIEI